MVRRAGMAAARTMAGRPRRRRPGRSAARVSNGAAEGAGEGRTWQRAGDDDVKTLHSMAMRRSWRAA